MYKLLIENFKLQIMDKYLKLKVNRIKKDYLKYFHNNLQV